jgi:nucleoside-diphosphate-sugar epimerase
MDKRKIAILGGSGFIGSRLVKRLSNRHDLVLKIIDIKQSQCFPQRYQYADVTQPESLRQALIGCDAVINLAAKRQDKVKSTSLYDQINVEGARNLCRVATELAIKQIIFTSSVAVYGDVEQETGEDGHFAPCSHYGKSKLEAEYVYEAWHNAGDGNKLTIIRSAVVFGEGDRGKVYKRFRRIAKGRLVMIGDGHNRRSMAYVENIAARLEYALDQQADYQVSNYADKPDLSMNQLTGVVTNVLGREDKLIHIPYLPGIWGIALLDLLGRVSRYQFSVNRAKVQKFCASAQFKSNVEHDFVAPVDLNQAIEKTVKHEFN